ncbi:MAG: hypothetical protein HRU19_30360 [Pseudobacteriovorax sp.]|nr:hypothetical protein [Pseudobacteriovorax sp.]
MSRAEKLIKKHGSEVILEGLLLGATSQVMIYNMAGWLPIVSIKDVFPELKKLLKCEHSIMLTCYLMNEISSSILKEKNIVLDSEKKYMHFFSYVVGAEFSARFFSAIYDQKSTWSHNAKRQSDFQWWISYLLSDESDLKEKSNLLKMDFSSYKQDDLGADKEVGISTKPIVVWLSEKNLPYLTSIHSFSFQDSKHHSKDITVRRSSLIPAPATGDHDDKFWRFVEDSADLFHIAFEILPYRRRFSDGGYSDEKIYRSDSDLSIGEMDQNYGKRIFDVFSAAGIFENVDISKADLSC